MTTKDSDLKGDYIIGTATEWFNRSMQGHHTGANKAFKRLKALADQTDALIQSKDAEIALLREALKEYVEATEAKFPSFEAGIAAQCEWGDRKAHAGLAARAALTQQTKE